MRIWRLIVFLFFFALFHPYDLCAGDGIVPAKPDSPLNAKNTRNQWVSQHPVVTVSGPVLFPPIHYYSDNNTVEGMAVDYLTLIANRCGFVIKVHPKADWADILEKTGKSEITLLACCAKTPEREKDLVFSKPYLSFPLVIITRKDSLFVGGIRDLKGRRVAFVKKNATYDRIKAENIPIDPSFVSTPLEALKAVSMGQADAFIENLAAASYLIDKNGLTNLKVAAPSNLPNIDLSFAASKQNAELISIINESLSGLTSADHTVIRNKWLSVRYEYGISHKTMFLYIGIIVISACILISVFITWNRKLQKEIRERERTEAALKESEQRFKDISLNIGEIIWEVDQNGCFTFLSEKAGLIFGSHPRDLIGKTHCDLMDDWEAVRFRYLFRNVTEQSKPIVDTEIWYRTGSDRKVCLLTNGIPIFDKDNRLTGFRGVGKDITVQKRLEEEKKHMESQLKQAVKMEAIGTMAGGIAHDFNNILGIIIGNAEVALNDIPDWNPSRKNLNEIKSASFRAREVVSQLLSFTRKTEQERRPIRAQEIVEDSVRLLRASIPSTIDIRTRISDHAAPILADSTQLHQIILNLSTNAVHSMEINGGILEICLEDLPIEPEQPLPPHLAGAGKSGWVHLIVRDTGHGIPDDIRDRIFDPYFTTKAIGKGTGIGLSVVLSIIKNNDGIITVDSDSGKGTTFHIYFPSIDAVVQPSMDSPENLPTGNERILYVDDEKAMVKTVELMLTRLGYSVVSETNPLEAVETFSKSPDKFDLIISDMTMPFMTGDKLIRKCFEIREDIPVILCTGYSEYMTSEIATEIGAKKLLEKPIDMHQLAVALRSVLDGKDNE